VAFDSLYNTPLLIPWVLDMKILPQLPDKTIGTSSLLVTAYGFHFASTLS